MISKPRIYRVCYDFPKLEFRWVVEWPLGGYTGGPLYTHSWEEALAYVKNRQNMMPWVHRLMRERGWENIDGRWVPVKKEGSCCDR
jgi:hypothetical protein